MEGRRRVRVYRDSEVNKVLNGVRRRLHVRGNEILQLFELKQSDVPTGTTSSSLPEMMEDDVRK